MFYSAFQWNAFQWNAFQIARAAVVSVAVKTGTGGIDPPKRKKLHLPVKPTGLLVRKRIPLTPLDARLYETQEAAVEIAAALKAEFTSPRETMPLKLMTLMQIDAEISVLLTKKLRTDEEDTMLLILLAANL